MVESSAAIIDAGEALVELTILDTSGLDEYSRLRRRSYSDGHVVLICFAINNSDSLEAVREKVRDKPFSRTCSLSFTVVLRNLRILP